jgi:hypothetical protein
MDDPGNLLERERMFATPTLDPKMQRFAWTVEFRKEQLSLLREIRDAVVFLAEQKRREIRDKPDADNPGGPTE